MRMNVTDQDAIEALKAAVQDYGQEWVDLGAQESDCSNSYYVTEDGSALPTHVYRELHNPPAIQNADQPKHCLAGHVFKQWGWDFAFQSSCNGGSANHIFDEAVYERGIEVQHEARMMICEAQAQQDNGETWGLALERVLEEYTAAPTSAPTP